MKIKSTIDIEFVLTVDLFLSFLYKKENIIYIYIRTSVSYPPLPGTISQYNCEIVHAEWSKELRSKSGRAGAMAGPGPGVNFWGRPLAWFRAPVKWGAHAKFRRDSLCRSAHTHILSPLYIRLQTTCKCCLLWSLWVRPSLITLSKW